MSDGKETKKDNVFSDMEHHMVKKIHRAPIQVSQYARRVSCFYGVPAGILTFFISTAFLYFSIKNNPESMLIVLNRITMTTFTINIFWFVIMEVLTVFIYYVAARLAIRKTAQMDIGIRTGVWGGLICGISGLLLWIILGLFFLKWHPAPASPQTLKHTALGMVLQPYPRIPIGPFNWSGPIMLIQAILGLVFLLIVGVGYYLFIMGLIPGLIGGIVASWTGKRSPN
jgi:hypothetical protein